MNIQNQRKKKVLIKMCLPCPECGEGRLVSQSFNATIWFCPLSQHKDHAYFEPQSNNLCPLCLNSTPSVSTSLDTKTLIDLEVCQCPNGHKAESPILVSKDAEEFKHMLEQIATLWNTKAA